jgi:hypothetical protein
MKLNEPSLFDFHFVLNLLILLINFFYRERKNKREKNNNNKYVNSVVVFEIYKLT